MSNFYPVSSSRSTGLLAQARILQQLHGQQLDIQRIQNQISTGRRLSLPSEDAPAAQRGQVLQRLLELKAQAQTNIAASQSYLDASDAALANVTTLLTEIRGLAIEAASDTTTDASRAQAAEAARRAIRQLLSTANQNFRGRYLFAGSKSTVSPFVLGDVGVSYRGNEAALRSFVDLELPYATSVSGAEVFGAFSGAVEGTVDLDPELTADTPLAALYGGRGVSLGSIEISDGFTKRIIDLSPAATLGDVAALLEANPPEGRIITALVTTTGLEIDIDDAGGGNLTIKEVAGGATARALQIASPVGTGVLPVEGGDLDPVLRLTTPLSTLQTLDPLDLASGLQIILGEQTFTVDTSAAATVEDLLNAINSATPDVLAEIAPTGDRITVRSRLAGVDFAIGENGGTTATQLGIRSLTTDTLLSDLGHGAGVNAAGGTDFTIRRKDGVDLPIDVSSAATIGDVLDLINNDLNNQNPATRVVARLSADGNGIELFDGNAVGLNQLEVSREFGHEAAWQLGLIPQGEESALGVSTLGGDTLTGTDPNPQEVSGIFNSLWRLQEALQSNDHGALERAVALLDQDFDRANLARGEIGSRGRTLDTIQSQLEDEKVLLTSNLSDDIDTDLPEAISQLAARQAALEASLALAAQVFQVSLLDFL